MFEFPAHNPKVEHLHGGPAPVRRYLPALIDLVLKGDINPGKVFDLTLPLDRVAEGYRAMNERRLNQNAAASVIKHEYEMFPDRSHPPVLVARSR